MRIGVSARAAFGGILFLALAVLLGAVAALGAPLLVAPFAGLLGVLILFAIPPIWLTALNFFLAFVAAGFVQYFGKINQAAWLPYLVGLVLYLHVIGIRILREDRTRVPLPAFAWATIAFVVVMAASFAVNQVGPTQTLIATKNYLFLWSAMFVFVFAVRDPQVFLRFWKGILVVAVIQIPVVLYQYLFVGDGGTGGAGGSGSWDAVSGTFGGSEFGGASGPLGIAMVVALLVSLELWRNKRLEGFPAFIVGFSALLSIALAEVKAALVIFLPLGFIVLYRRDFARNPLRFLRLSVLLFLVLAALFTAYRVLHYGHGTTQKTTTETIEEAIRFETDPDFVRAATGELGRIASVVFWWREVVGRDTMATLIGYGPGSVRWSSTYVGDIAKRYPFYQLDRTAIAVLLWDSGILGAIMFVSLLGFGFIASDRLSSDLRIPSIHRTLLLLGAGVILIVFATLPYNRSAIDGSQLQLLLMLALGQVGFWRAHLAEVKSCTSKRGVVAIAKSTSRI